MPDGDSGGRPDKRVLATERTVILTLASLIGECDLRAITITRLCKEAGINRGTFYNHWKSVDELVSECEEALIAALSDSLRSYPIASIEQAKSLLLRGVPDEAIVCCLKEVRRWAPFFVAIIGPNGDGNFARRMHEELRKMLREDVVNGLFEFDRERDVDFFVFFNSSAFLGVLSCWMAGGCKESPEEVALKYMRLLFLPPGTRIAT